MVSAGVGLIFYLARRFIASAFVLVSVLILVFGATHGIGDPASVMLPLNAPAEQRAALRESLGLDDPFAEQLIRFLGNAFRGEFGESSWQQAPALDIAWSHVPATIYLAFATLLVAVPTAVASGVVAAARRRSLIDRTISWLSLGAVSVIDFAFAIVLILVFAVHLRWVPTSGYHGYDGIIYYILPVATLATPLWGRMTQITRGAVVDELRKPYLSTARAKGLSERRRVAIHALRNAAVPIASLTGTQAIGLMNGAIIVETVFGWPGIGYLLIQAITNRDIPLIEACVFVTGIIVIGINLMTDIAYAFLNPKIRY